MFRRILFFLLLPFSSIVCGQTLSFEHITQQDGLPSPTVTAVLKDSYGFMWFGTRRGLVRYDGYTYIVFDKVPSETGEPVTNFFFSSLIQANDSTLLLVHNIRNNGFYSFNLYKETFEFIPNTSSQDCVAKNQNVFTLFIDQDKRIWLGTGSGLARYDIKSKIITHYPLCKYPEFSKTSDFQYVSSIIKGENGQLWLFCANGYVAAFDTSRKTYRLVRYSTNPMARHVLNHGGKVLFDHHQTLWIGTEYEGIFTYNTMAKTITHFCKENGELPYNDIMDFCEDKAQNVWVAGGCLLRYNRSTKTFQVFKNNPNDPSSLSGNAIYSLDETSDGVLWVGNYAAGINIYKKGKQKFEKITAKGTEGYKLSYKSVLSFAEAPDGSVLIGTDGGGINKFNPQTKKVDFFTTSNSALHSNIINTMYFDKTGQLWVGSYGKGLCRYSYKTGLLQRSSKVYLDGKGIWKIIQDNANNIWIGSLNRIYAISLDKKGDIRSEPIVQLDAPFGITNTMVVDSKGIVWVGTSSMGLGKLNPNSKQLHNIQSKKDKPNSLPSNNVTSFLEDRNGVYWVGTEFGGLSQLLSFEKNEFRTLKMPSSLFRSVNGILEDQSSNLWLSTDNGIVLLKSKTNFVHFNMEDGLQNKEFNVGACLMSSEGKFYFGGTEGLNYLIPDSIHYNRNIPAVYITDIKLFTISLTQNTPFHGKTYLSKPCYLTKKITLNYQDNVLSIGFSALDYTAPTQNKYRYTLEGFDLKWFDADATHRSTTYTNLPPGKYTFRVIASNNDGYWNKQGAKLEIEILPPWWMTWWFRALLVLMAFGILVTIYFWRIYSIKKKNKELKELVTLRTTELKNANDTLVETNHELLVANEQLEAQNEEVIRKSDRIIEQQGKIVLQNTELNKLNETKDKFFSIIAHDLRNPVTVLNSLSDLLVRNFKNYSDQEKEQLAREMLDSSSSLKKLTLDLLDWATSQTKHYQVNKDVVYVHFLVDKVVNELSTQAKQKNILLSNQTTISDAVIADEKMLATIVRNLLSNAVKYSPNGSVVSVFSQLIEDKTIKITIEDHGVGMTLEQAQHIFNTDKLASTLGTQNEKGIGLGLIICKEFIALNNGRIEIESEIGKGTKVHLFLSKSNEVRVVMPKGNSTKNASPVSVEELPSKEKATEGRSYKNRKVLVIDDEPTARKVLRSYLSDHFEIYEAENGRLGLHSAQTFFPEIIICDLNMPFMNGFEFCHRLKEDPSTSHIACIVLTGQTETDVEKRAIEAGADEFLTKPYDAQVLIRRIINQLHTRDQIRKQFNNETDLNIKSIAKDKTTQEFLEKCVAYIESRLSDPELHADDLCKELGLSKTLLYEKIKNLSGLTVNEFIKVVRLKHSLEFLKRNDMSISQIAFEVGFNSLSYFTRSFTKQFGKSPSEYVR